MAAYSILVGTKGGKRSVEGIGDPAELNAKFKAAVIAGGEGLDLIELISTRNGRTKRRKFKSDPAPAPAKPKVKKISKE